jgi:hypothetical protein
MSTLQVALAIAGGVVLAGVVAHSAWTSRKSKPRQAEPDIERAKLNEPGLDPDASLGAQTFRGDGQGSLQGAAHGAAADGADGNFDVRSVMPAPDKRPMLDALIDVIAPIELESPASGDAALAAMPPTRRVGTKHFSIEGLNSQSGEWETPRPGQRYGAFQAGVQLANRLGPLNEIEFSEFVMKTRAFADALDAEPEFPEMLDEVSRARELDHFAGAHDAQLSFTLKATDLPWSPGYVQQNAARLGFVAGVIPGRMVIPASTPGLPPILDLSFDSQAALADDPSLSAIRQLTLTLDVPQVDRGEEPFARMCFVATELARIMDGQVTDDHGQPLSEQAIQSIHHDLRALYDTLDARDLSAGSPQARRLFN